MNVCPHCGYRNLEHAAICFQCGKPLDTAPSPADELGPARRSQRILELVRGTDEKDLIKEDANSSDATDLLSAMPIAEPVTCLRCGTLNPVERDYCIGCGSPLMVEHMRDRIRIHASARTDPGQVRENNEDSVGLWSLDSVVLALVADGMGGAAAGEEASRITVEAVQADFLGEQRGSSTLLELAEEILHDKLLGAIQAANMAVINRVDEDAALRGMGTTATLAFIRGRRAIFAHVGDSRAYLVDGTRGWVTQITSDHSFVEALLAAGHINAEEAEHHPMKNVLYRALGQTPDTTADLYDRFLAGGDRIVLCSDGLTRHLSPDEIAQLVLLDDDPHAATQRLIDLANARGGEDNISAVVILIEELEHIEEDDGEDTIEKPTRLGGTDNLLNPAPHQGVRLPPYLPAQPDDEVRATLVPAELSDDEETLITPEPLDFDDEDESTILTRQRAQSLETEELHALDDNVPYETEERPLPAPQPYQPDIHDPDTITHRDEEDQAMLRRLKADLTRPSSPDQVEEEDTEPSRRSLSSFFEDMRPRGDLGEVVELRDTAELKSFDEDDPGGEYAEDSSDD